MLLHGTVFGRAIQSLRRTWRYGTTKTVVNSPRFLIHDLKTHLSERVKLIVLFNRLTSLCSTVNSVLKAGR